MYSYGLEEAQALTELPTLPSHEGLICQGWNWSLDDIKALNREVTVGAMCITDDGATRLHIRIATIGRMDVPLYIGQTVANGVSIDWGDGSDAETLDGTGNVNTSHTYAEPGDYTISLMPDDGCTLSLGDGTTSYCVLGSTTDNGRVYRSMLKSAFIGRNVTSIGEYAFYVCHSLSSVTISNSVTSIGKHVFHSCSSLSSITIPNSVTSIGEYAFDACQSLSSITIPNSVTTIGSYAFYICKAFSSVTIPNSVTSIGTYAFSGCSSLSSITIPNSVTTIGSYTFYNCEVISSATLSNSVRYYPGYMFALFKSLSSITMPDGVVSLGQRMFQDCCSLASIAIPSSFTGQFASYRMSNVYAMRYIDLSALSSVPMGNTNMFGTLPSDCQILIPSDLYDKWKSATNWST